MYKVKLLPLDGKEERVLNVDADELEMDEFGDKVLKMDGKVVCIIARSSFDYLIWE